MILRNSLALLTATLLAVSVPTAIAQQQQVNVVYAEAHGVGLVMDIFTPTGERNGLAIVDVISGAWNASRSKIRDHERAQMFRILCSHGYTVFAIRPGSLSRFSITDMVKHLEMGVIWVKSRADEYGIDPNRIGLTGASAGGHLASLVAVSNGSSDANSGNDKATVKAVAVFFPPTDFLKIKKVASPEAAERIRRITMHAKSAATGELTDAEIEQALMSISPAHLVTKDAPPFLLIHGTADEKVPQEHSEILQAALRDKGVSAELILKEGGGHPWLTIHEEVAVIANWFDEQLGNEANLNSVRNSN